MTKKYEFTGRTKEYGEYVLRQIRRLSDGKVGGWIEKESNLSHEGNCWVHDSARVFDNAKVRDNAQIYNTVWVCHNAKVFDNAKVIDNAVVYDTAKVCDNACICNNVSVCDNAIVSGNVTVNGNSYINSPLLYHFKLGGITYYVMEGNLVTSNSHTTNNISRLIDLWHDTVPGINLEKFLKEVL